MTDRTTPSPAAEALRLGQLIGGRDVLGARTIEIRNPARRSELVGVVDDGSGEQVAAAVTAASGAAGWGDTTPAERAAALRRAADAVDADADALAELVARENGSAKAIVRWEAAGAAAAFRDVASRLDAGLRPVVHDASPQGRFVRIERRPFGVVACIVPWNAPLILTANKIAPALGAGNTVVLKPSPASPLGASRLARIVAAELPPGVLNVVNGGEEVGAALVEHPRIRKVSFTGGGATARHIMRQAAGTLTPVHFELGGNDPAIVLDDADLDSAAERIAVSAFRRAGQVCFAVKRVYVPRARRSEFLERLIEHVDAIVVGDPLDARTTMGPVNNAQQFDRVRELVHRSAEAGRDVRELGVRLDPEGWEDGFFLPPVLVLDAEQSDELVREEQFGPVLPVIAYDDEAQAIEWANDTEYGLCSSVWSESEDRALRVAGRIEAGMTIVNNHLFTPVGTREIPFGGWKQSGIGWESSVHGLEEYLQFHSVDVQTAATRGAAGA